MAISEAERDAFIMESLDSGMSLSEVQDQLGEKFGIHLTYMELRMLTAELQINWSKQDQKAEAQKPKAPEEQKPAAAADGVADDAEPADDAEAPADDGYGDEPMDEEEPAADAGASGELRGKTTVEISKVVRPGAMLSGSVKFGSGASAEWYIDQYGRAGLIPAPGSKKPDRKDMMEFQRELQKAAMQRGY